MNKRNIVVVESGVRASRLQDFFRMVSDGTIDGQTFDYFIDNIGDMRKMAGSALTWVRAISILGSDKVIQPSICAKWNFPEINLPIRYRENTLREADQSNKKGDTDFCLVFFPGMSLIRQREIRGMNPKKPPYFSSSNDWWLDAEEKKCQEKGVPYWAKISSPAGLYLVDFKPRFADMNWQAQENEIANLDRTPEDVFLFAVQSIYMLTGKNVTSTWCHWGRTVDSAGCRVNVTLSGVGEANVCSYPPDFSISALRVSLSRKFEF